MLYVAGGLERCLALLREQPVAIVGARRASAVRARGRALARTRRRVQRRDRDQRDGGRDRLAPHTRARCRSAGRRSRCCRARRTGRTRRRSGRCIARLVEVGAAVSELPPGAEIRRWMFPARNRIIAALSAITVVVEARHRSGALVTARYAAALGRTVGAVPGRITSPQVSRAQRAAGATARRSSATPRTCSTRCSAPASARAGAAPRAELEPEQAAVARRGRERPRHDGRARARRDRAGGGARRARGARARRLHPSRARREVRRAARRLSAYDDDH